MIWAQHGFLGSPEDWQGIAERLSLLATGSGHDYKFRTPNLLAYVPIVRSLPLAAQALNTVIAREDTDPVLLAYSLGARLALHQLLGAPDLYAGAILVSPHPGLPTEKERAEREVMDLQWAQLLRDLPLPEVMERWEAQPVFRGTPERARARPPLPKPENAPAWAQSLATWGLGQQLPLGDRLSEIACPVLWVVGEEDPKFRSLGEQAAAVNPLIELWVVPGQAHRVPWEAPDEFSAAIDTFIRRIFQGRRGS